MARLKCPCGLWKDIDEMAGHRLSKEHTDRMKPRNRKSKPVPSGATRAVLIPRTWRAD